MWVQTRFRNYIDRSSENLLKIMNQLCRKPRAHFRAGGYQKIDVARRLIITSGNRTE